MRKRKKKDEKIIMDREKKMIGEGRKIKCSDCTNCILS